MGDKAAHGLANPEKTREVLLIILIIYKIINKNCLILLCS